MRISPIGQRCIQNFEKWQTDRRTDIPLDEDDHWNDIKSILWKNCNWFAAFPNHFLPFRPTLALAWRTNQRTDRRTVERTEKESYRDAWMHLKIRHNIGLIQVPGSTASCLATTAPLLPPRAMAAIFRLDMPLALPPAPAPAPAPAHKYK